MNMNSNTILAAIAIAAIFSPAIVSIVDNIFKFLISRLEYKRTIGRDNILHTRDVYVEYMTNSINVLAGLNAFRMDYRFSLNKALAFFPDIAVPVLSEIDDAINSGDSKRGMSLVEKLSNIMRDYLN
ncbi:hypothetical protein [Mogibacterium diversum]|uniref:hypothetical protein n=1 Tax=Mogibacterium diversum TaxID=114527 RepID=UPI0028D32982|nr:hypothetical protein [Mogibacterium diversum]